MRESSVKSRVPAARTVAEMVSPKVIASLVLPSNLRYGRAIFRRGGVEFITNGPLKVEA